MKYPTRIKALLIIFLLQLVFNQSPGAIPLQGQKNSGFGKANSIFEAHRQSTVDGYDKELAAMEKELGLLQHRLNDLRHEMDSLQSEINVLRGKEVVEEGTNLDKADTKALLQKMEAAKDIGLKKKKLEVTYRELEFEYLAKNQEANELSSKIEQYKSELEVNSSERIQAAVPENNMESSQDSNGSNGQKLKTESINSNNNSIVSREFQGAKEQEKNETIIIRDLKGPVSKKEVANVPRSKRKQVKFKTYKDKQKPSTKKLKEKSNPKKKGDPSGSNAQGLSNEKEEKAFKGLNDVDVAEELNSIDHIKAEFYLERAVTEIERRQFKKADKFVEKSLRLNPQNLDSRILKGDINAAFGFYEKAIRNYDHALALDSNAPKIYYNRAHCFLRLERNEDAYTDFSKAIQLDGNYILAFAGRASISIGINDFDGAISDYTRIIQLNKHFIPAYKGRGVAYMELGDYTNAMEDFDFILDLSPNEPAIYYKRGLLKVLTDQLYDACFDLWTASEMGYREANKAIKKYCD